MSSVSMPSNKWELSSVHVFDDYTSKLFAYSFVSDQFSKTNENDQMIPQYYLIVSLQFTSIAFIVCQAAFKLIGEMSYTTNTGDNQGNFLSIYVNNRQYWGWIT